MADWLLRPVFTRTPRIGTPLPESTGSFSTDDGFEGEDVGLLKIRPSSRVSSYMGLRSFTPPAPAASEPFSNIRHPDDVYHKPSADQVAETLKVVMMNQSMMSPIPPEFNSCVLHLLEGYHQLRSRVKVAEDALEEMQQQHEKDIKALEDLQAEWDTKETNYKADVKRLEVLLSKTDGGMDQVMLARGKSQVRGSRSIKEVIGRHVDIMKERSSKAESWEREPYLIVAAQQESRVPRRKFHKGVAGQFPKNDVPASEKGFGHMIRNIHLRKSTNSLRGIASHGTQDLPKSNVEATERGKLEEEHAMSFGSTSSDTESTLSEAVGLGLDFQKPLPELPGEPGMGDDDRHSILQEGQTFKHIPQRFSQQMGFSFNPGDDTRLVAEDTERTRTIRKQINAEICQRRGTNSEDEASVGKGDKPTPRLPSPSFSVHKKSSLSKPHLVRESHSSGSLSRDGSSSSIVTAVRHDSQRSSLADATGERKGKQRDDRSSSAGSEAATAATRAIVGSGARRTTSLSRTSPKSQDRPQNRCHDVSSSKILAKPTHNYNRKNARSAPQPVGTSGNGPEQSAKASGEGPERADNKMGGRL